MVGKTGFEPATPWSQTRCTTKLCYFPLFLYSNGALGRNRTHNLLIRSQALYPVELLAPFFLTTLYYIIISLELLQVVFEKWCPGPESNRHGFWGPQDFKSCASTSFATWAHMEVPTGLEPMITELQSVALPTWPWNHSIVSSILWLTGLPLYNIPDKKILQAFLTKK